jgi:hypothetical protein
MHNEVAAEVILTEDILSDDNTNGVNIGTGIGDSLASLGQGLGSVIDSINPVDDFMDNIKQVIIIVVIAVSVIIVIVVVVVVTCCIANRKEIWKTAGTAVEKFVDKDVGNQMRHVYDDEEQDYSYKFREGVGDALAGLGNGLASVIDSVNPVDDFMDNIKQVINDTIIVGPATKQIFQNTVSHSSPWRFECR